MEFIIRKEIFEEAINKVGKITLKKVSLPILENLLIETEKNFVKISATNLESGIIYWVLGKIEKPGKTCVNAKFLNNVVNSLPKGLIKFLLEDYTLKAECDTIKFKIKTLNPEEFPIIPLPKNEESIFIDNTSFIKSLLKTINFPSPSLSRPEISGIFLSFEKNLIRMAATDSFRLAEKKIFQDLNLSKEYNLILPQSAAKEFIQIFGDKEGKIKISFSPSQIFFEFPMEGIEHSQILFTSRLIEGEYPNYQEIIPKKFQTKIKIKKEEFLNQIKTASLFSGKMNEVKLKVKPKEKKIEVLSQNPDFGEYKSEIEGEIEGEEILISFNHRFLTEGILAIEEKNLLFELTSEEGPAILRPEKSEDYFYVLMPIKAS